MMSITVQLYCFLSLVRLINAHGTKKVRLFVLMSPLLFVSLPYLQDGAKKAGGKTGTSKTHFLFLFPPTGTPALKNKDRTEMCHFSLQNLGYSDAKTKTKNVAPLD